MLNCLKFPHCLVSFIIFFDIVFYVIKFTDSSFSLVSAPVLFQLEHDPSLYAEIEKGKISVDNVNYEKIRTAVLNGPGLPKTKALQRKHTAAALAVLESFPANDARTALENIILAMQDL